jgi:uncharacterized SAM-binding protein YcdF (DUF218 family)
MMFKTRSICNQPHIQGFVRAFRKGVRITLLFFGALFLIAIIISFTHIPYHLYHALGTRNAGHSGSPDYIILLGGGGMPGGDGMLKSYYTAQCWSKYKNADVIVALPADTSKNKVSPELLMARELVLRGIDSSRIKFESKGYNTRTQAQTIKNSFDKNQLDTLCFRLITTPEHMFRSVSVFRKSGFQNVGGNPAFEHGLAEKGLKKKNSHGRGILNLRYNVWSYLQYELLVVREYFAIAYYKMRGWM